ncbi:MAG: toll/interleukin-1 receptor domain-containing protein [Clostridia bacterium]|nr:toll/interleukin-1 receptor domain-containing protein [Clostridia bacterium]
MDQRINVCVMGIDDTSTFSFNATPSQAFLKLKEKLEDVGIRVVNTGLEDESAHALDLIKQSDAMIVFFPLCECRSVAKRDRIKTLIKSARERDVKVFYISESPFYETLRLQGCLTEEEIREVKALVEGCVFLELRDGNFSHSVRTIAAEVYNRLNVSNEKAVLYDKLSEMKRLGYQVGMSDVSCKLIRLLCEELPSLTMEGERKRQYKEILRLWISTYHCGYYDGSSQDERNAAHVRMSTAGVIDKLTDEKEFQRNDAYYAALALHYIYLNALTCHDAVETITNDDVHILRQRDNKDRYIEQQRPFYQRLCDALADEETSACLESLTPDEKDLIDRAEDALIETLVVDSHGSIYRKKDGVLRPLKFPKAEEIPVHTEEEKVLLSIADLMQKASQLFYGMTDRVRAVEYMRCLKTSYERLKNYCEIVGDKRIAAECVTKIAEIVNIIEKHAGGDSVSEKIENGIKAYLGLKIPANNRFDVFLSYKHEDKDIVKKLYYYLKENHLHTFLDFITLPELSDSDYEEAIMNALDSSQHFVVVITKLEQLESHWIKLEMKTFKHEMSEGRKQNSNFIILVSDDVYDAIISSNKSCLPIRYRSVEVIKISAYRETLASYLTPTE